MLNLMKSEKMFLTFPFELETSGLGAVSKRFNLEFSKKLGLEFSLVNNSDVELSLVKDGLSFTKGLFLAALAFFRKLNLLTASGPGDGTGVSVGVPDGVGVSGSGVDDILKILLFNLK